MATLDRLREIVKTWRSPVPAVDPSARPPAEAPALRRIDPADHARAALELGGALVEHADGAVIVVDREYRADMLHGRTPIGEIVATIAGGDESLQMMAKAWPAF